MGDFDLNMAKITKLLLLLLSSVSPVVLAVQPIVIVPGLGGSVLEANINNRTAYRDCHTDSEWFTIWVAQSQIAFRFACFLDGIVLEVDTGSSISNASGIEIRPRDFGGVDGVEYSNAGSGDVLPMPYMHEMIVALEAVGYKRGVSLRAATYDFRVAGLPEVLQWQYSQLKWLIEDTAAANDGQRVHLLSHSLGGPYANLFLTSFVSAPWKAKYIESHMMFSPPMAGTPVALDVAIIFHPRRSFCVQGSGSGPNTGSQLHVSRPRAVVCCNEFYGHASSTSWFTNGDEYDSRRAWCEDLLRLRQRHKDYDVICTQFRIYQTRENSHSNLGRWNRSSCKLGGLLVLGEQKLCLPIWRIIGSTHGDLDIRQSNRRHYKLGARINYLGTSLERDQTPRNGTHALALCPRLST